jgi:hypothetical protein
LCRPETSVHRPGVRPTARSTEPFHRGLAPPSLVGMGAHLPRAIPRVRGWAAPAWQRVLSGRARSATPQQHVPRRGVLAIRRPRRSMGLRHQQLDLRSRCLHQQLALSGIDHARDHRQPAAVVRIRPGRQHPALDLQLADPSARANERPGTTVDGSGHPSRDTPQLASQSGDG